MFSRHRRLVKLATLTTFLLSSYAYASGMQLDTSYSSAGYAWAGRAALYDDASTGYYNPALYSAFRRPQVGISGLAADVNIDVKMLESSIDATAIGAGIIPTVGNDRASVAGWNTLAGLHAVLPLPYRFSAGLNVALPWGLTTNYPRSSKSRYFAQLASLKVVDIDPGISYELFDCFSVGVALDAIYSHFSSKVALPTFIPGAPFTPGPADTYVTNEGGDKWSFGWNAGILYRAPTHTQIGLGYHSKVSTTTSGSSEAISGITGAEFDGDVHSSFVYPAFFNVSIVQDLNPCWAILADVRYTNWSKFDKATLAFSGYDPNLVPGTITIPLDWRDTLNYAIGVSFKPTEDLKFKAGFGYDETPVRNEDIRPFAVPDNNRYVIGLGAQYCFNRNFHFDAGYTAKILDRSEIDGTRVVPPITITSHAKVDTMINEFNLSFNWTFT